MKVSIITVCYNSAKTIEDTIKSVLNQSYDNIEYIIIDGQSKDNTMEIVNNYSGMISKVVSEKDKGMYDACNKGIAMATGDVIGILNSDDVFANKHIVQMVVDKMKKENTDALYGDLKYVSPDNLFKTHRYWKSGSYKRNKFIFGWMPPHPTFFIKKEAYQQFGGFNLNLKSAADYELMLRMLFKNKLKASYLPTVMVLMRDGGMSNATINSRLRGNTEDKMAWKLNGLQAMFFTMILKPIRKIPQFIFKGIPQVDIPLTVIHRVDSRQAA